MTIQRSNFTEHYHAGMSSIFLRIRKYISESRTSRLHLVSDNYWSSIEPNVFQWCVMVSPSEPITLQMNLYSLFKSTKYVLIVYRMTCSHVILCIVSRDYIFSSEFSHKFANIPLHDQQNEKLVYPSRDIMFMLASMWIIFTTVNVKSMMAML